MEEEEQLEEFDLIDRGLEIMTRDFRDMDIEEKLRENGMWK